MKPGKKVHFLTPPKFSKFCQIADFGFGFDKKRPAPRAPAAFFETQPQNHEAQPGTRSVLETHLVLVSRGWASQFTDRAPEIENLAPGLGSQASTKNVYLRYRQRRVAQATKPSPRTAEPSPEPWSPTTKLRSPAFKSCFTLFACIKNGRWAPRF